MKKLLNTLYAMSEDIYLSLDGENAVANRDKQELARYPLHTLQSIVSFSYAGLSPALMGECAKRGIGVALCSPRGRFLVRVCGEINGNVLLRRTQYRAADDEAESCRIARCMIFGKLYNSRWSIERTKRDHALRVDIERLQASIDQIKALYPIVAEELSMESLRGSEGIGAKAYFDVFDSLILHQKDDFCFAMRSKRPPLDRVNAMLSFLYTIFTREYAAALESVGLDSYMGFYHSLRPGRESLACDLVEEGRCIVERFVLTLINLKIIKPEDFDVQVSGAVFLNDDGRKKVLSKWQEKKRTDMIHPYLKEKIPMGLLPYVQSMLLAKFVRGEIDEYPCYLVK